jgi:hypothetical protein
VQLAVQLGLAVAGFEKGIELLKAHGCVGADVPV